MISKEEKEAICKEFGENSKDSGATAVQIALLTKRINGLAPHFVKHKHDFNSNRGLMKLIGKRKALLKYLAGRNREEYTGLLKRLNFRR